MSATIEKPRSGAIAVSRLLLVNTRSVFWMPAIILGGILLLNIGIWAIVFSATPDENRAKVSEGIGWSGSSLYLFVYVFIFGITTMNVTFRFALGFGATRRNFYLGASLTYLLLSVLYTVVFTLLAAIEEWTNGWGFGGHMFTANYFSDNWVERSFTFLALFLFCQFLGAAFSAIFVRWRAVGLLSTFAAFAIVLLGIVAIITFSQNWSGTLHWVIDTGRTGLAAWSLVLTGIAAALGYLVIRRAAPRS